MWTYLRGAAQQSQKGEKSVTSNNVFVEAVTLVGEDIVLVNQNWQQKFKRL